MRKVQTTHGEFKKANPQQRSSKQPQQRIREAGVLTAAGIEQGHTQSEVPQERRKNFDSFGSE